MRKRLSLDNFNPNKKRRPYLTSPRSIEACKRQGIHHEELLFKSKETIWILFKSEQLDPKNLNLRFQAYEQRRKDKLADCINERQKIISEEKTGLKGYGSFGGLRNTESSILKKEMRMIQKMKQKQEAEIQQMISHEIQLKKIRQKNMDKFKIQKLKEEQRKLKLQDKKRQMLELKVKEEERKKIKAMKDELERKRNEQERQFMLQKKEEEQRKKERDLAEIRHRREEEKSKKKESLKLAAKRAIEQQRKQLILRKDMIAQRDIERREKMEQERLILAEKASAKQMHHKEKIKQAKEKMEKVLMEKKVAYNQKLKLAQEKKEMFEKRQLEKAEISRKKALQKVIKVQKALKISNAVIQKKKDDYEQRVELMQLKKQQKEKQFQIERQMILKMREEKKTKRLKIKNNNNNILNERKNQLIMKQREQEMKIFRIKDQKEQTRRDKANLESMKKMFKMENVKRNERKKEYERQEMMVKIMRQNNKLEMIKNEKNKMLAHKLIIKQKIDLKKEELMQKVQLVKEGRLEPKALLKQGIGIESVSLRKKAKQKEDKPVVYPEKKKPVSFQRTHTKKSLKFEVKSGETLESSLKRLKHLQNLEILDFSTKQQIECNQREAELDTLINKMERKRLIKINAVKKAKSKEKLISLMLRHNKELLDLENTLKQNKL